MSDTVSVDYVHSTKYDGISMKKKIIFIPSVTRVHALILMVNFPFKNHHICYAIINGNAESILLYGFDEKVFDISKRVRNKHDFRHFQLFYKRHLLI